MEAVGDANVVISPLLERFKGQRGIIALDSSTADPFSLKRIVTASFTSITKLTEKIESEKIKKKGTKETSQLNVNEQNDTVSNNSNKEAAEINNKSEKLAANESKKKASKETNQLDDNKQNGTESNNKKGYAKESKKKSNKRKFSSSSSSSSIEALFQKPNKSSADYRHWVPKESTKKKEIRLPTKKNRKISKVQSRDKQQETNESQSQTNSNESKTVEERHDEKVKTSDPEEDMWDPITHKIDYLEAMSTTDNEVHQFLLRSPYYGRYKRSVLQWCSYARLVCKKLEIDLIGFVSDFERGFLDIPDRVSNVTGTLVNILRHFAVPARLAQTSKISIQKAKLSVDG